MGHSAPYDPIQLWLYLQMTNASQHPSFLTEVIRPSTVTFFSGAEMTGYLVC